MKKIILLLTIVILSVSCGFGEKPIEEDREIHTGDGQSEIEIVIENGLEGTDLVEIWIDPSREPWSENLLDNRLAPSEEFVLTVDEATDYDIQLIDEDGESYTLAYQSVDEDGFEWYVTSDDADWNRLSSGGTTTVTIENGLRNYSIWYLYCTYSSSDDWGSERLDYMVLEPGESFSFEVETGYDYDYYARNGDGDFYFSFDNYAGDDGFTWVITSSDLDNSIYEDETHGASAEVTLINRIGNMSILYAFEDESGGEYWGADLLEGYILEPRQEFTFNLPADKFYDFQVEDEYGNTYTLWEVAVKDNGIFWEVIQDDLDDPND